MDKFLEIGITNALFATALALAIFVAGLKWKRPALFHALWVIVLVKLVTPPLVPITIPVLAPWTSPDGTPASPAREAVEDFRLVAAPATKTPARAVGQAASSWTQSLSWSRGFATVWIGGSLLWFLIACARTYRFHQRVRRAPMAPEDVRRTTERLCVRMLIRSPPEVRLLDEGTPPALWVLGSSRQIIVPARLWKHFGEEEKESVIAHELAHLIRRDHWVRWLEVVATTAFWWHPVLWWAKREIAHTAEVCCDARVVSALPLAARAYAKALLETVEFLGGERKLAPGFVSRMGSDGSQLKKRFKMILSQEHSARLSRRSGFILLALCALILPALPTWSQEKSPDAVKDEAKNDKEARGKNLKVRGGPASTATAPIRPGERSLVPSEPRPESLRVDLLPGNIPVRDLLQFLSDATGIPATIESGPRNFSTEEVVLAATIENATPEIVQGILEANRVLVSRDRRGNGEEILRVFGQTDSFLPQEESSGSDRVTISPGLIPVGTFLRFLADEFGCPIHVKPHAAAAIRQNITMVAEIEDASKETIVAILTSHGLHLKESTAIDGSRTILVSSSRQGALNRLARLEKKLEGVLEQVEALEAKVAPEKVAPEKTPTKKP